MKKTIYATDGNYTLVPLSEDEKENFLSIFRRNDNTEEILEQLWRHACSKNKRYYSIYDIKEAYCGYIELTHLNDSTPEIGIELLEAHRNKGIAGRMIKLLARTANAELPLLEYYILKVSVGNPHSKHMIEKLGAIQIGEEESFAVKSLRIACNCAKNENDEFAYKKYSKMLEDLKYDETSKVLVYKLTMDQYT